MMACTDRHERFLLRLTSNRALLYTEMVTTAALVHGKRSALLEFNPPEHPLALQLGGNNPCDMARCARLGEEAGYDEVNINVGCPSERVQSGCFGAALMAEPRTIARCVESMRRAVNIPVTVKTRIGIDNRDTYEHLHEFVGTVVNAGCDALIIHARKAWLSGLSPKENREIPPLRHDIAERVAADFPRLPVVLNGGIRSLSECERHLEKFAGVMLGRQSYSNPYLLANVDKVLFGEPSAPRSRADIVSRYLDYVDGQLSRGVALRHMSRHLTGMFQGQPGARRWRRYLGQHQSAPEADRGVVTGAMEAMGMAAQEAAARSEAYTANY